jgi:hypothetical protein
LDAPKETSRRRQRSEAPEAAVGNTLASCRSIWYAGRQFGGHFERVLFRHTAMPQVVTRARKEIWPKTVHSLIFKEDHTFKTPSGAGGVLLGRPTAGRNGRASSAGRWTRSSGEAARQTRRQTLVDLTVRPPLTRRSS